MTGPTGVEPGPRKFVNAVPAVLAAQQQTATESARMRQVAEESLGVARAAELKAVSANRAAAIWAVISTSVAIGSLVVAIVALVE